MPPLRTWQLRPPRSIPLDRARILWILNATPDSFSDGGAYPSVDDALRAARRAISDGADAIDVGGESTRPGASPVPPDEQVRRTVPIIRAIRADDPPLSDVPISIDTTSAHVAEAAIDAGADAINDVSAGRDDPRMLALAAERRVGLILMHRLRHPQDDSFSDRYASPPRYGDVAQEVAAFLCKRAEAAIRAGVNPDAIVIDPGLGFGKSVEDNLRLIAHTRVLTALGFPVLSGISRKSFAGRVSIDAPDSAPRERLLGSLALAVAHRLAGASVFRVHDVRPHRQALAATDNLLQIGWPPSG